LILTERYKIVGMDTEFPGIVYRITENAEMIPYDVEYKGIKMNVDKLKVIQVGLSFADDNGFLPPGVCTW